MKKFILIFLSVLLLVSCAKKPEYEKHSFFAMDTFAEVRIYSEVEDTTAALKSAQTVAENIEKSISKTLEDSPIYKINSVSQGSMQTNEYLGELFDISMELSELTNGYFTPLSGGIVELWTTCENEQRLPTDAEIAEQLDTIDNAQIIVNELGVMHKYGTDARLDFGAIGKGYAADKMADELKEKGVATGMITFTSTIAVFGERDFKIAVRTPDTSGETAGYITMRDEALSVSGDYERFYTINGENYNHIIDPYSGRPASNGIHSVAVVCESAAVADALSTAIFAMGTENAMTLYSSDKIDFEALIITDEHIIVTPGMAEKFELVSTKYKLAEH